MFIKNNTQIQRENNVPVKTLFHLQLLHYHNRDTFGIRHAQRYESLT